MTFMEELHEQRWDDHRYYHRSRINQSLHFFSSCCFVISYVLLFTHTATAVVFGWIVAQLSRQVGHFVFEPKDFDEANGASHAHKESIKIGYNLRRKVVLLSVWGACPVVLGFVDPSFFGLLTPHLDQPTFIENVATLWLFVAGGALLVRAVQLFFLYNVQTGFVWLTKILTDPFHDIKIYHRSPLHVLRGDMLDPMDQPI